MRASLCCNWSLLTPVYKYAQVRAKQHYGQDGDRTRNMGVLLHGDGAFSGQVSGAPHPAALWLKAQPIRSL
jgi:2-oxoglutarate dehydrogenase complex dehydrogenase (E1) component-like enzyme